MIQDVDIKGRVQHIERSMTIAYISHSTEKQQEDIHAASLAFTFQFFRNFESKV